MLKKNKVVLNLRGMSVPDKIQWGRKVMAGINGNKHFANPNPSIEEGAKLIDQLETANSDTL
jgi:hypothetical protein